MSAMFSRLFSSFKATSPEAMSAAKETCQKLIDDNAVVLFGKSWCPFSTASCRLLTSLDAEYKDLNLDLMADGRAIQDALYEMTGQSTVPSVFINHKHIGGNSELQALGSQLPQMLKEAGAIKA